MFDDWFVTFSPSSSTNDERQTEIWDWSCIQNDQRHQERWRCSGADLDKARPGIQVILLRQSGHHLRVFRVPRPVRHQPSRKVRHPMHYAIPLRSLRHSQAQALRRSRTGEERTKFRVYSSTKFKILPPVCNFSAFLWNAMFTGLNGTMFSVQS